MLTSLFAGIDTTGWAWHEKLLCGLVLLAVFFFALGGKSIFKSKQ
jgi:hypothetical protein